MIKNKKILRWGLSSALLIPIFIIGIAFSGESTVSAQQGSAPSNPNPAPTGGSQTPAAGDTSTDTGNDAGGLQDNENEETTCSIEKLGWLLCPVIETAGRIGDKAFQFLATTFLETEPELVSNDETGTRYAWELARNLANIMFIIVFLIIIYSQVTGAGINNYGIKKMMPRLVVAALAVNVSYYICQLMVDLSNVMGYEIQNFMVDTAKRISDRAAMPPAGSLLLGNSSPGVLEEIVMAILAGAAVVWMLLPFVFVGVGTIVITCIIILVILLLRKAFIVLLIVASPIAFVLYLLPNTEKYFQKWLSMFWKLLMVFPVVGILMGGGQLASAIILSAGSNGTESIYSTKSGKEEKCIELPRYGEQQSSGGLGGWWSGSGVEAPATDNGDTGSVRTGPCDSNSSTPLLLGLVAAGIAVAPLLAVFSVLKGALSAAGAIGGKIAGAVDTYTRKGGEWGTKNTAIGRGMAARSALKQNYKNAKFTRRMTASGARGALTRTAARGISGNVGVVAGAASNKLSSSGVPGSNLGASAINGLTGGMQAQNSGLAAHFASQSAKQEKEDKDAEHVIVDSMPLVEQEKQAEDLIARGDFNSPRLAALLEKIAQIDQATFMKLGNKVTTQKPVPGGTVVSRAIAGSMSNTGLYGGGDVAKVANGQASMNLTSTAQYNLSTSGVSANDLAKMSNDQLKHLDTITTGDATARANVASAYAQMSADQRGNLNSGKQTTLSGF